MQRFLGELAEHAHENGIEAAVWGLGGKNDPGDGPRRMLEADKEHQLRALLASIPKPAAVFFENDHIGATDCRVARFSGIRIPEDLVVIGYWDNLIARFSFPPLTSIIPPGRDLGSFQSCDDRIWNSHESAAHDFGGEQGAGLAGFCLADSFEDLERPCTMISWTSDFSKAADGGKTDA
jgi:hypothetical protein